MASYGSGSVTYALRYYGNVCLNTLRFKPYGNIRATTLKYLQDQRSSKTKGVTSPGQVRKLPLFRTPFQNEELYNYQSVLDEEHSVYQR